jgi:hypothetical protein
MRQEKNAAGEDGQLAGYTFYFQIANGGERRACSVRLDAPDAREASVLFREKWPVIESMARDGLKAGMVSDGVITLVMP